MEEELGLGGVLSLLWFQRRLPGYACKFFEMVLMVTADHGPAVSGAHNTIVCARAGKDLISSLTSGLLTIGDRFGGALDAAAKQFSSAYDKGLIPMEFVNKMRKNGQLIMGIGHRVKSINNPDMRVKILKDFVIQHFPSTPVLNFALEVEKITTSKVCASALHFSREFFLFRISQRQSTCGSSLAHTQWAKLKLSCLYIFVDLRKAGLVYVDIQHSLWPFEPSQHLSYVMNFNHYLLSLPETQLNPKRRWAYWCGCCGPFAFFWNVYCGGS